MGKVRRIRNIPNKQKNPYRYPYGHRKTLISTKHHYEAFQPVITGSKLTIGTLEKGVKYVLRNMTPERRHFAANFEHI